MRKFIAFGISAITVGSMFLTAGGSASAAETTTTTTVPKTIVDDVCASVPDAVSAVTDAIAALDAEADQVDYDAKKASAQTASTAFVTALVNYLEDTASNAADLPISTSTLTVRQAQYVDAVTAWGQSAASKTQNWGMSELLGMNASSLAQLADGLGCVPPVVPSI